MMPAGPHSTVAPSRATKAAAGIVSMSTATSPRHPAAAKNGRVMCARRLPVTFQEMLVRFTFHHVGFRDAALKAQKSFARLNMALSATLEAICQAVFDGPDAHAGVSLTAAVKGAKLLPCQGD